MYLHFATRARLYTALSWLCEIGDGAIRITGYKSDRLFSIPSQSVDCFAVGKHAKA